MTGRYLTDLADVLYAAGLDVVEFEGWQTRARSSGGYADGRPWAVVWHHTASSASIMSDANYCANSEDAPICNALIARDGQVWVIAAGASNTNGKGGPWTVTRGTVPIDQMNTHAVGLEICNNGVGEPYPAAQIDAVFTASLAICEAYGLAPFDALEHNEWAPDRKIDPATAGAVQGGWRPRSVNTSGTWSGDDLRGELLARAADIPPPLPPQEDDMTFIYAFTNYANTFSDQGVALTPEAYTAMVAHGAVVIVSGDHDQHVDSLLHLSGLDRSDLVPK